MLPLVALLDLTGLGELMSLISERDTRGDLKHRSIIIWCNSLYYLWESQALFLVWLKDTLVGDSDSGGVASGGVASVASEASQPKCAKCRRVSRISSSGPLPIKTMQPCI